MAALPRVVLLLFRRHEDLAAPADAHSYGGTGQITAEYFGLTWLAEQRGLFLIARDGLVGRRGNRGWDPGPSRYPEWDRSWLSAVLRDVKAKYRIDASRVFVFGHSQGYGDLQNTPPRTNIPSAHQTAAVWARNNGCTGMLEEQAFSPINASDAVDGDETVVECYSGCRRRRGAVDHERRAASA